MDSDKYCIITTTCDDEKNAKEIANILLERRLVSCVQFIDINSSYHWKGKIESATEILLQLKSKKHLYKEIEKEILTLHNYETPQIIMYDIVNGYSEYIKWIDDETKV